MANITAVIAASGSWLGGFFTTIVCLLVARWWEKRKAKSRLSRSPSTPPLPHPAGARQQTDDDLARAVNALADGVEDLGSSLGGQGLDGEYEIVVPPVQVTVGGPFQIRRRQ